MELYKKYRPQRFEDMVGQDKAVKQLKGYFKKDNLPHCMIFSSEASGCGKTTAARIVAGQLGCNTDDGCDLDYREINAAMERGIDMARDLRRSVKTLPMKSGRPKVYVIDEAHRLTGEGQDSLLKVFEDTPEYVYFILCTTNLDKIIKTIQTRSAIINFVPISAEHLAMDVKRVLAGEKCKLSDKVITKLCDAAEGSGRQVLMLLEKVLQCETEGEQLDALKEGRATRRQAFDLVKALLWGRNVKWEEIVAIIDDTPVEDYEKLRRAILTCAAREIRKHGVKAGKAGFIVTVFRDHWYDCGGEAGLWAACQEVFMSKR